MKCYVFDSCNIVTRVFSLVLSEMSDVNLSDFLRRSERTVNLCRSSEDFLFESVLKYGGVK